MKKIHGLIVALVFFFTACQHPGKPGAGMPLKDDPYRTPVSEKYILNPKWSDAQLRKVVVNGDNSVFVLTDKGVYRDFPGNIISKDLMYSSLADKIPMDICIQEGTGYLYYLYTDRFLTNMHAGTICGHLPSGVFQYIRVNSNDDVLLVGGEKAALYNRNNKIADLNLPEGKLQKLYAVDRYFWYLTPDAVYKLEDKSWKKIHEGKDLQALAFGDNAIAVGTSDGYYLMDSNGKITQEKNNRLPVPAINEMLSVQGKYWFATYEGAFSKESDRFAYYASKRWLDQDSIIDMTADKSGNMYFLTPSGLNKIEFREETLAQKAEFIQDNLRKYHMRFGFSVESRMKDPADPTSIVLEDDDNDGLWTAFYLGSQAFRYAVTGDESARRYVWESFEPYERLLVIHPITGFSGRTFERTGYIAGDTVPWRPSPDPDWWWKGTTSTDEFVGYIFNTAVIDKLIAQTPEEKKRIADYIDAIMTHIITNDYYFIDHDGKPTLWGRWNPDYVNSFAPTQFDRRLNSALTIAGLQLAYQLTQKEIYKTEAFRMMKEHGYLENMKAPMKNMKFTSGFEHAGITLGEDWNHSDDEMAFMTYWVLYHYAFNDTLKQEYTKMITDHWEIEKPERNALWNLLSYDTSGDIDLESTLWYLRTFPSDTRRYSVKNSHRKDLEFLPQDLDVNFREQRTTVLPPKNERPLNRHNANEFDIDGGRGEGNRSLAGDEYLLPYWMARYLKVVE